MSELYFFDLPLYRCSEAQHHRNRDNAFAKLYERLTEHGISPDRAPESYRSVRRYCESETTWPWDFNEIVGWLRLFANPTAVSAHYFSLDAKPTPRRTRRKRFYLSSTSDALATYFPPATPSDQIYSETLAQLTDFPKHLRGRQVIDLRLFRTLGPHINWRSLLETSSRS